LNDRELQAKQDEVMDMEAIELDIFAEQVSTSRISDKVRYFLFEVIDTRRAELDKKVSAMAVSSEVKIEGIGVDR